MADAAVSQTRPENVFNVQSGRLTSFNRASRFVRVSCDSLAQRVQYQKKTQSWEGGGATNLESGVPRSVFTFQGFFLLNSCHFWNSPEYYNTHDPQREAANQRRDF